MSTECSINFMMQTVHHLLSTVPRAEPLNGVTGIILGAGMGRRMGELTQILPKPLLPVLNCPLFGWNLAHMLKYGIYKVFVNTHYIKSAFEPFPSVVAQAGLTLHLQPEENLSGPFGGVLACYSEAPKSDNFFILAGDGLYKADMDGMLKIHCQKQAELTIGVTQVENGSLYGVLEVDDNGIVHAMREKPFGVGFAENASCGIYIVSSELLERMTFAQLPLDWIDLVQLCLTEGRTVIAQPVDLWMDAGSPEDLLMLNLQLLKPDILKMIATQDSRFKNASVWLQGIVRNHASTRFEDTVLIGSDVLIDKNTKISNSIIGSNVQIGENVEIRNSLIMSDSIISGHSSFINTIVA